MRHVRPWDIADGDAQFLEAIPDEEFDFLHASHCLEHMVDVKVTLENWSRVVRRGGDLVITVPDEDMYERGTWPSKYNPDHKHTFTVYKGKSWSPVTIRVLDLVRRDDVSVEKIEVIREFYDERVPGDQTMGPCAECAIEIVLRRT